MELAASWRPFRKSNASATTIRPTSSGKASSCTSSVLGVVDHDAVDFVRDVFKGVGDPFEMLVDLASDDELHRRVGMLVECLLEAGGMNVVDAAFEAHH